MEQYGKIIDLFCNVNEFVAFVWVRRRQCAKLLLTSFTQGPLKFLLQVNINLV